MTTPFKNLLAGRGWVSAKVLAEWLDCDARTVRELASESGGEVISGFYGYRLTSEATSEEIRHAANRLRSQAAQMTERAAQIETTHALKHQLQLT